MLNRRLLIANSQQSGGDLPSGYTRCEYLESQGRQAIVLPQFTGQNKLSISFMPLQWAGEQSIFGGNKHFEFYWSYATGTNGYLRMWEEGANYLDPYDPPSYPMPAVINTKYDVTFILNAENESLDAYLFSYYNNGFRYGFVGRIYSFSCDDNSINLIPALDPNNVPCMFDTVTQTPFYNAGTGDFLYG